MEDDTRAEIARRRLAALTAEFDQRYRVSTTNSGPNGGPATTVETGPGAAAKAGPKATAMAAQTIADRIADSADNPANAGLRGSARHVARRRQQAVQWRLSTMHVRVIIAVVAAIVVAVAWWLLASRPQESAAAPVSVSTTSVDTGDFDADGAEGDQTGGEHGEDAGGLIIDVGGKVKKPGIVELPAGSRVVDAIKAAGGTNGKADTTTLNLARKLQDGEQILVGIEQPPGSRAAANTRTGGAPGPKVNVNTASSEELQTLPGVGPATAQAIMDYRTRNGGFAQVDGLLEVKGIGPATLEDLKDLVTV